jgi:Tfp pilus assembly protein PilF
MFKVVTFILLLTAFTLHGEDRFWVAVKVDGKPDDFVFDTGADRCTIIQGLGEHSELATFPDKWTSEDCMLTIGSNQCPIWFFQSYLQYAIDQPFKVLSWTLFTNNILQLEAETGRIILLQKLPVNIGKWTKVPMVPHSGVLALNIGDENRPEVLLVDTGSSDGVFLPTNSWRKWRADNRKQPATLNSYGGLDSVLRSPVECWAKTLKLGVITLTETPVQEATEAESAPHPTNYTGTIGVAALKRLDFIIDDPNSVVYVRPKLSPAQPYDHLRDGIAFLPDEMQTNELAAHVLEGGPGWRAGVRDGDLLLRIDDYVVTNWHTDTNFVKRQNLKPGTALRLTLARGTNVFNTTVVEEQILGPAWQDPTNFPRVTNDFLNTSVPFYLTPYPAFAYSARGYRQMNAGKYDRAITDLNEAIRLDSTNYWDYLYRAACENRSSEYFSALNDLADFFNHDTNCAGAYFERGFAHSSLDDITNAIRDYSSAINIAPDSGECIKARASLYWQQEDFFHAAQDYRRVVALNTNDTESFGLLGYLEATSTNSAVYSPPDAIVHFRKTCELTAWTNSVYIIYLGLAYARTGDFDTAIKYEERSMKVGSRTPEEIAESQKRIDAYKKHDISGAKFN